MSNTIYMYLQALNIIFVYIYILYFASTAINNINGELDFVPIKTTKHNATAWALNGKKLLNFLWNTLNVYPTIYTVYCGKYFDKYIIHIICEIQIYNNQLKIELEKCFDFNSTEYIE